MNSPCTEIDNIKRIACVVDETHADVKVLLAYHNQKIGEENAKRKFRKSIKSKIIKIVIGIIITILSSMGILKAKL